MSWPSARLGEHARIEHGWAFAGDQITSAGTGRRIVSIGNFSYSGGFRGDFRGYTGDYPTGFELSPGDLLMVMTCQTPRGEILGLPAIVPDDGHVYLHNQRIGKVTADSARLDARFLFYVALTKAFNEQLFLTASGTKILHTSPGRMREASIPLPSLSVQRAIAAVLGALDDKIEANGVLNARGQELMGLLFAAHSAETRTTTYEQVAEVQGGGTPSTKTSEFWGGDVAWATPTDVTGLTGPYLDRTNRYITELGLANCASVLHPVNSILMTSRATLGAFALAKTPLAVNQGFIVANARNPLRQYWLYHEMRTRVNDYIANANGATFLELSRGRFKAMELEWPEHDSDVAAFTQKVQPLHDRAYQALTESARLATLRDALLPHLMSGRLSVREAEQQVEEVL